MLEKLPDAVGHALRKQRAGLEKIAFNKLSLRGGTAAIDVASLAFADHAPIPANYTADGAGASPPLSWTNVPSAAASLLLIVEDADAPTPEPLVHAIVVDLPPQDGSLPEGALKSSKHEGSGLATGLNSYMRAAWLPPDPPPGHGTHRYCFQLFALTQGPAFAANPGRDAVRNALAERGIASGLLIGTYERPDGSVKTGGEQPTRVAQPANR